jgi:hypothetical protein
VAWLSPLSFYAKQNDIYSRWKEGTGKWLIEADLFKAWLDGTEKTLGCPGMRLSPLPLSIWVYADQLQAGAGKTILSYVNTPEQTAGPVA